MSDLPQISNFKVFPKHTGVWEGNWTILDANCQEISKFTALLTQKIVDNQWRQTNVQTYTNGKSETQNFVGHVVGEGQIEIESPDSVFLNYKTLATEVGDNLIIFQIWDKTTNSLRAVETINLVSCDRRIRTTQSLTEDGKLRGVMVIVEQKIE
ncbi:DUF3598 family protein [Tychonema sp. LEGE 07203]|uniref:DUF3598 family protein n=1 Tax=Tychonema sp. LEGE 07203 TaxID=1828671 RepID=UPI00188069B6|nr:DUF3598 family protein [Tychonema sp. LEGE 07203]MBE9096587.1 DUF3598 family protein [Tychonema sp. LEGE 07203]